MKKFLTIIIFVMLSSVSYAEDWKWAKAYNSVVLVSGENVAENIIDTPFSPLNVERATGRSHDRSIKPRFP